MKKLGIFLLSSIFFAWSWHTLLPHYSHVPAMEAWMLNVGQGESVLLREPSGKKLLFDGGPDDSVLKELGAVLPPWDRKLDLVILSHPHSDHIRGLISVLERYNVTEVWTSGAHYKSAEYRAWQEQLKVHQLQPRTVFAPFRQSFGTVSLQVYHPLLNMEGQDPSQAHDATVSVKASFGTQDIFLTGDLNEEHETEMVSHCQPPTCTLEAEILQIPHHGSATGLIPPFLAAIHPQAALIPVGTDNKFKHPRPNILQELQSAKVPIYRTDQNGRLHITCTQKGCGVSATIPP